MELDLQRGHLRFKTKACLYVHLCILLCWVLVLRWQQLWRALLLLLLPPRSPVYGRLP